MKVFISLSSLILYGAIYSQVLGSNVAFDTSTTCDIKGGIISVEYKAHVEDPCLKGLTNDCPIGAVALSSPALYELEVDISSLDCISQILGDNSYQQYLVDKKNTLHIYEENLKNGEYIEVGDTINGRVEFINLINVFTDYSLEKNSSKTIADTDNVSLKKKISDQNNNNISIQGEIFEDEEQIIHSENKKGFFRRIWERIISLF